MNIYDNNNRLAFFDSTQNIFTRFQAIPSDFAYAYVESLSPAVGAVSKYSFSLTFGVDTPDGTIVEIDFPDEVEFPAVDPLSANSSFSCTGTHTLNEVLSCNISNERSSVLNVYMNAPPDLS